MKTVFLFSSVIYLSLLNTIYSLDDFPKLKEQLGSISAVSKLIGLKSATLGQIRELNINIPAGIILSTESYKQFQENKCVDIPEDLWEEILQRLRPIEEDSKLKYGSPSNPLLLSIRGDSPNYMVGMLDSVTYVGLNDLTARAMERNTKNRPFVYDCYRRLVQEYGVVVNRIPLSVFEEELEKFRKSRNLHNFNSFSALDYIQLTKINKAIIVQKTGKPFPQDPFDQLKKIITAVFSSQSLNRVKLFKQKVNLVDDNLSSVLIMPMIYGNRNITTSSTIVSTRDLITGSSELIGESATNATCRDITVSQRDSLPLTQLSKENSDLYNKVTTIGKTLEKYFKKPQVIDYVYENGQVYVLQSANAQLTPAGKFKVAKDMVDSEIITKEESLFNFEPEDVCQLLAPQLASSSPPAPFCKGNPSGNACVVGKVCLTNESAIELAKKGESAILFKKSISSSDFEALIASSAVVTCVGNNFSLGASLTRLFRKTAALGCAGLIINSEQGEVKSGEVTIKQGNEVTVTGDGQVIVGAQELVQPQEQNNEDANEVLKWADDIRKGKIRVFSLATSATEASQAAKIGSDGIGTFSVETFFEGDNKRFITDLVDASNEEAVSAFANHLQGQLKEVFANAGAKTVVTIRLFDPQPSTYIDQPIALAKEIGALLAQKDRDGDDFSAQDELDSKMQELEAVKKSRKKNPSFGSRSIRLLVQRPDLLSAEIRAILSASKEGRSGGADESDILTRIVVPFVSDFREVKFFAKKFEEISLEVGEKAKIGVEVDTVRGCLDAGKLAEVADFITLSIPQLVEATFSLDLNDEKRKLVVDYNSRKLFNFNELKNGVPGSVQELMRICADDAKSVKNEGEVALFSEEFNNPDVIRKFTELGVNSFICRPQAVPIARLCAAKNLIQKNA